METVTWSREKTEGVDVRCTWFSVFALRRPIFLYIYLESCTIALLSCFCHKKTYIFIWVILVSVEMPWNNEVDINLTLGLQRFQKVSAHHSLCRQWHRQVVVVQRTKTVHRTAWHCMDSPTLSDRTVWHCIPKKKKIIPSLLWTLLNTWEVYVGMTRPKKLTFKISLAVQREKRTKDDKLWVELSIQRKGHGDVEAGVPRVSGQKFPRTWRRPDAVSN